MKSITQSILKLNTIKSFGILLLISLVTLPGCKEEEFYHTVSVTVIGHGVVTPMQGEYVVGSTVNLTATPDVDNVFVGWTGDTRSTDNPLLLVIRSDFKINANFEGDEDGDGVLDSQDMCSDTPDGVVVMEDGCPAAAIYLDDNGVTVKTDSWTKPGSTGELDGITYTVVDREMLDNLIASRRSSDISSVVTTLITDMSNMNFSRSFNQDISAWDVSNVADMSRMFEGNDSFNQDLSSWDVSNVTDMTDMFAYAESFNQDISTWDVSSVSEMSGMFSGASMFNQDLSNWDVSNVTDMSGMFSRASMFNQDLSNWDVSNVTSMYFMFYSASSFNQDLSSWDVSSVTSMYYMFEYSSFNSDISSWDVSSVTNMSSMFSNSPFNQDISSWDVSNVTDMMLMFDGATAFNQDLSAWDVSKVASMGGMFNGATSFNQNISAWDVSSVTGSDCGRCVPSMALMFRGASNFDQDISSWDVSSVKDMHLMFSGASSFNQDLSNWDVSNVEECSDFSVETPSWTLLKPNFTNCDPNG